jgi:hypothetical protein
MNPINHDAPSEKRGWNEKSASPIAARTMTAAEREEYRKVLVQSYQCEDADIAFDFERIRDENDDDRDDCLWLIYRMKCVVLGKPTVKDIFRIKQAIPDELKQVAERMRQQKNQRARAARKQPLPIQGPDTPARAAPVAAPGPAPHHPAVRRPANKRK